MRLARHLTTGMYGVAYHIDTERRDISRKCRIGIGAHVRWLHCHPRGVHAASTHRDSGEQAASSKGCRPVELQIIPVDLIGLSLHAFPAQS